MGFILYCFPSCSLYSSHAGFIAIPWSLQTSSHLGAFSFTVLSSHSVSQKSTNLVPSLLSGLCSDITFSEKLSLTILSKRLLLLFLFYVINLLHIWYIYLFVSFLPPFIMVVWIIFFLPKLSPCDSAKPPTSVKCICTYICICICIACSVVHGV